MKKYIRNFSIIAHIDHGKSTLSEKIIKLCETKNFIKNKKILNTMDLEQEKGITIKSQSIYLQYIYKKNIYKFNLIDTPGHIDFCHEVSKSLHACEGVLLIIDAKQGIESQTLSNYNMAKKLNLKIVPIINKIDLPNININNIKKQIKNTLKINKKKIILCSAKNEYGIKNIIHNIIKIIPYPKGKNNNPLEAIIIDSYFDNYLGIILLIKIKNGLIKKNDEIKLINKNIIYKIKSIFIKNPCKIQKTTLYCGEVAWISCNIKKINYIPVGSIITSKNNPCIKKIKKLEKIKPQIYAGIYPVKNDNFSLFENSFKKLNLNDSSLTYKQENSLLLGYGYRCGFLGILHMEITKERLKREHNLDIIIINPTVKYKIKNKKNKTIYIKNSLKLPPKQEIKKIQEPISTCYIISPKKYLGKLIKLCITKRGIQKKIVFINKYVKIKFELPTIEIITNFVDKIKSISSGYASFEYKFKRYQTSDITSLDVIINQKKIDILSTIIHKKNLKTYGKKIIKIIKNNIPKHLFNIDIKASCNNKIISSTKITALRKNVTSKCYGGDISRKKKLLKKQKEGKKKMKKIGQISIPQKTFFEILKIK